MTRSFRLAGVAALALLVAAPAAAQSVAPLTPTAPASGAAPASSAAPASGAPVAAGKPAGPVAQAPAVQAPVAPMAPAAPKAPGAAPAAAPVAVGAPKVTGATAGTTAPVVKRVNLNTATAAELDALPGVGDKRSAAIIAARPFTSADDLVARKVLPQAVFDGLKDRVAVR